MSKTLAVHNLPTEVDPQELAGATVVVIDLLRASTTICTALANGALEVRPFLEVEETLQAARELDREEILLGGERGGKLIPGFDIGNSPAEYTAERVRGKRLLFTTTNGTRALNHARVAKRVIVGALANLSVVVEVIHNDENVQILCAGTGGKETREDILAAGAFVERLVLADPDWQLASKAESAQQEWQATGRKDVDSLAAELRETSGGKNLLEIGHEQDLHDCARVDLLRVVPEFDAANGRIVLP